MSVKIFLSTVSGEFRTYRDFLRSDLTRHNVEVKVQEDFKDLGRGILDELDIYIASCDAVVHLVGDMTGSCPGVRDVETLFSKYPNLSNDLPPLGNGAGVTYTQWEAWLALYHCKELYIVQAGESAERGPRYAPTDASRAAQTTHLKRLREVKRYPPEKFRFTSAVDLANYLKSTGILDLLVRAYAEEEARARKVAEGFIHEMAQKVAGDRKGPGNFASVSEVNTDKIAFAFAQGADAGKAYNVHERAQNGKAEALLNQITINQLATQLGGIRQSLQ